MTTQTLRPSLALLCLSVLAAAAAAGQPFDYSVVHAFENPPRNPGDLVDGQDGFVYGTTAGGGLHDAGTVFRVSFTGERVTLYAFSGPDGSGPNGLLVAPNGDFFGTTRAGGALGYGTIFRITRAGVLTTLHSFDGQKGVGPVGTLAWGRDGRLYGMTGEAGSLGHGTVFRATQSGRVATLCRFVGPNGLAPTGSLILARDGNFYGTVSEGGAFGTDPTNGGAVVRVSPAGVQTVLHSFSGPDGARPVGGLVEVANGVFYGTTSYGGGLGQGTVFRILADGTFTSLWTFSGADGALPYAPLVASPDGYLYGTTSTAGLAGGGTVFRMGTNGVVEILHAFSGSDGAAPRGGMVRRTDGSMAGTTFAGGFGGAGTVFAVSPGSGFASLHSFAGSGGRVPRAPLLEASDGDLYGTTALGGAGGLGTVFRVTKSGGYATLASFSGDDGSGPDAGLVEGVDGALYGTTQAGGSPGFGNVFRVTKAGSLASLHAFAGPPSDGSTPAGRLLAAGDGKLYGTTRDGGPAARGTVFRVDPSGGYDIVTSFFGSTDSRPAGGLALGSDGFLYGSTHDGDYGFGTFFRISTQGALFPVATLQSGPGRNPLGDLVRGAGDEIYGSTDNGGSGTSSVFRLTPDGSISWIKRFEVGSVNPGLFFDGDGSLLGTAESGLVGVYGGVFRLATSGLVDPLYAPTVAEGTAPKGGVVRASDGALYGTAQGDGPLGGGVVFRLASGSPAPPQVFSVDPPSGGSDLFVTITGKGFRAGARATFGGIPAGNVTLVSETTLTATTPPHGSGAVDVAVSNPDAQTAALPAGFFYSCGTLSAAALGETSIPVGGATPLLGSGGSCAWTPPDGLSDPASCTPVASPAGTTTYSLVVSDGVGCRSHNPASVTVAVISPSTFFALPPCRIFDSRTDAGGALSAGALRVVPFFSACGVAAGARAVVVNATVVSPSQPGVLAASPADGDGFGAVEFPLQPGRTRASAAILPLGAPGDVAFLPSAGTTHLVLDVAGYFR